MTVAATEVLDVFPAPAINCLTGCFAELAARHGAALTESDILARGDGYLLRAGADEWGYPEYTFAVEEVGLRGMAALGGVLVREDIEEQASADQLRALVRRHRGVVVWTNSSHLTYADVYASSPGYLHAVLVIDVANDGMQVRIHDSLVVDRERHGCDAWMPATAFAAAITDRVRTETYDHMGAFHTLASITPPPGRELAPHLQRQATRFWAEDCFRGAIADYRRRCLEFLEPADERSARAARRLFDHINVLYVVPNLRLLETALADMDPAGELSRLCREALGHWRALAMLALKFEATCSPGVLDRIMTRFELVDGATLALWEAVVKA